MLSEMLPFFVETKNDEKESCESLSVYEFKGQPNINLVAQDTNDLKSGSL